jgi:hypothetical protein
LLHQIKGEPIVSKEENFLSCHGLKLPRSRLKTSTRQTSLHFLVSRSIKVKYHIGTKKTQKTKKEFRHNISHLFTDVIVTMSVTHRVFKAFVTISVGGKEAAMAAEDETSKALSQRRYRTRGSMRARRAALASDGR